MLDELHTLTEQSAGFPLLTALLLGLLAAINPCQLAINVSALTYLFRQVHADGQKKWLTGAAYLAGRCLSYSLLGWGTMALTEWMGNLIPLPDYGVIERLLPYVLLSVGLFFLYRAIHSHRHDESCHNSRFVIRCNLRFGAFWMGCVLAFLFCPESALVFFGMMVPLGVAESSFVVPLVFSFFTVLPLALLLFAMQLTNNVIERYVLIAAKGQRIVNILFAVFFIALSLIIWLLE